MAQNSGTRYSIASSKSSRRRASVRGNGNQYTGDGIMALFGAPISHEDHALRACYAALHLRERLSRYTDELRLSVGLNLGVRTRDHDHLARRGRRWRGVGGRPGRAAPRCVETLAYPSR